MDKIKFTCFNCNAKLEIDGEYGGRRGRCPKCKAKNTIPSSEDTLDDSIIILLNDMEKHEEENEKDNLILKDM